MVRRKAGLEMIKLEACQGCGRHLLVGKIANLDVKCEPTPLIEVGEIIRLLTTPNPPSLWMVERNQQGQPTRLRGARPGETGVVVEHRCTVKAADAVLKPSTSAAGETMPPKAPRPSVARSAASSGHSTDHSGVRGAANQDSSWPACDRCSKPMANGTYASVEIGELTIWAEHVEGECAP